MDVAAAARLIELNRRFYDSFAAPFAATRRRVQPGVARILAALPLDAALLDLGCGNAELLHGLLQRGFRGRYLGVDFSVELLAAAREELGLRRVDLGLKPQALQEGNTADLGLKPQASQTDEATTRLLDYQTIRLIDFLPADLTAPDLAATVQARDPRPFDYAFIFATLHHLPGRELRAQALRQAGELLKPGGRLALSVWQFLNSPRLRARIQPWQAAGFAPEQLDPGDYLLDWRSGGQGLRYAHHFTQAELEGLAGEAGFAVGETFVSDGKEGDLGLYQVWAKRV